MFDDPESVAQFSVAMRLALIYSMILLSINSVFAPHFVEAFQRSDMPKLHWLIVLSTRAGWLFGAMIVAMLMIGAPAITHLFGNTYSSESASILRVLLLGQCANIVAGPVITLLNMTGHDGAVRDVALLSGSVLVLFCFILAPSFGVMGVAVATVCSMISHNAFAILKSHRHLGFSPLMALRRASKPPS